MTALALPVATIAGLMATGRLGRQ